MSQLPGFLDQLDGVDRHTAMSLLDEVVVEAGEMLMRGDQESGCVAYVMAGEVEVHAAHAVVGRARAGEWVGETALFPSARRRATVWATEPCRLLALPTEAYVAMRRGEHPMIPHFERDVLRDQVARMRRQAERIAELSAGAPHTPPSQPLLSLFAAEFGPGGLLSRGGVDVPARLRALGVIDAEESDRVAAAMCQPFVLRTYAPGTALCREGEAGDALFIVLDGEVAVVKAAADGRPRELSRLAPGAVFGLAALLDPRPRMASCVSVTQVTALDLGLEAWQRLVGDATPVGSALRRAAIRVLGEQIAKTNLEIARVAGEPTRIDFAAASWEGGAW